MFLHSFVFCFCNLAYLLILSCCMAVNLYLHDVVSVQCSNVLLLPLFCHGNLRESVIVVEFEINRSWRRTCSFEATTVAGSFMFALSLGLLLDCSSVNFLGLWNGQKQGDSLGAMHMILLGTDEVVLSSPRD